MSKFVQANQIENYYNDTFLLVKEISSLFFWFVYFTQDGVYKVKAGFIMVLISYGESVTYIDGSRGVCS